MDEPTKEAIPALESLKLFNTDPAQLLKEMEMKPILASGPGGQHVNKTSSAIQVYHPESGIRFKVQDTRDQFKNREIALERLEKKLKELNAKNIKKQAEAIRKQKKPKKRPWKIQQKVLNDKRQQSDKKKSRNFNKEM